MSATTIHITEEVPNGPEKSDPIMRNQHRAQGNSNYFFNNDLLYNIRESCFMVGI